MTCHDPYLTPVVRQENSEGCKPKPGEAVVTPFLTTKPPPEP